MGVLSAGRPLARDVAANPFASASAMASSNYCTLLDGRLVRALDSREPSPTTKAADEALRSFLLSDRFSCVAAKAAVASGGYRFGYYPSIGSRESSEGLARDLNAFVMERPSMPVRYATFVAGFGDDALGDERWFEAALWTQLERLNELDSRYYEWDSALSNDPGAKNFGFSFAGKAFFVVGVHPRASRASRRAPVVALAFNAHSQFDEARRSGHFGKIQRFVREREIALEGSVNPELAEFGTRSEARQYSGRRAPETWACPFKARP